jgi:hypothetical protein
MKVKVYLNEGPDNYFGFDHHKSALRLAAEFDVELADYDHLAAYVTRPHFAPDSSEEVIREVLNKHDLDHLLKWASPTLNKVFEQLNVGGEMYPAEAYTVTYRLAGNRSLSVGDVITFGEITQKAFGVEPSGWSNPMMAGVRLSARRWDREDHEERPVRTDITVDEHGYFIRSES